MRAINPFAILGIDENASREEIELAYRRLARLHHPDLHATGDADNYTAAVERMAEITYAYELLTNPHTAAAHKRKFDRARRAGIVIEPAPRSRASADPQEEAIDSHDYRRIAAREFAVDDTQTGVPWSAKRPRRWLRRR